MGGDAIMRNAGADSSSGFHGGTSSLSISFLFLFIIFIIFISFLLLASSVIIISPLIVFPYFLFFFLSSSFVLQINIPRRLPRSCRTSRLDGWRATKANKITHLKLPLFLL